MQIKVLEDNLKLNIDGKLRPFVKDDIATVDDDIGALACQHGWAEDVSGATVTGARVAGANGLIQPRNVKSVIS